MKSEHLGGKMLLVSGAETFPGGSHVTDPVRDGLRIVVALDGAMTLTVGDQPELIVDRPTVFAVLSEGESARDQHFSPDLTFRYVLVWVDAELLSGELGAEPASFFTSYGRSLSGRLLAIASPPADAGFQAVAGQIIACPEGRERNLYRAAKALELVALSLDLLRPTQLAPASARLTASEIDKVEAARTTLIGSRPASG